MPIREDDDIDIIAGLSASRDDTPNRDTAKQKTPQRATKPEPVYRTREAHSSTKNTTRPASAVAKRSNGLIWFMMLMLLAVMGVCGWLGQQVVQLQQQQSDSQNALQLERSRMESISAQVHETGSSFAETGNVLESKFAFFDSEIRKLWDVTNKRNRQEIDANTAQLAQLKKSTLTSEAKLQALEKDRAAVAAAVEKVNNRLASDNAALRTTIEVQNEQLLLIEGQLKLLKQRLNKVPDDLSLRVAKNEEAVKAIDASRQQLVKRFSELQQRLDDLTPTNDELY